MKRLIPLLALCLVLMGQSDCDPAPTPPGPVDKLGTDYCWGNEYSVIDSIVDGVSGIWNTIIGGESSADRRATVRVRFGNSYCSGVVLTPNTVLTAGHCGYGVDTEHTIVLGGYGTESFPSSEHLVHPDYLKYVYSGNRDYEARKADLMLLYTDKPLPGPYIGEQFYKSISANVCGGLVAQGWGRHEGDNLDLRETKYLITDWADPKYLKSKAAQVPDGKESGRICFGDSGGPLYADLRGKLTLAGITTTTMSSDCMAGGTHVSVDYFKDWIVSNMR